MRRLVLALGLLAFGAVAGTAVAGWLAYRWALEPAAVSAEPVRVEIPRGTGFARVAAELGERGLVRSELALRLLARRRGLDTKIHVGEYAISAAQPPLEILEMLANGRVMTYPVVLPEGLRASEIAARLEDAGLTEAEAFMAVVNDAAVAEALGVEGETLEGYLFPETYRLPHGMSAREVAEVLVKQFHTAWAKVAERAAGHEFSMKETVTLASIVEKETGAAEERPRISGVFHNRMQKGMKLETDPTVIYGIPDFDGNLRRRHLDDASNPYNTYQISGLPPGPIANPGLAALEAAVEPEDTPYLFFVSKNDGTHHFSRTYREHVNAVNRYQLRRGRR